MARQSRKRFGIEFSGFTDLITQFERLEGDIPKITEECLEIIPEMVNPELHKQMKSHKRTGNTEKSIVEHPKVEWEGSKATISVGFDISNGGLPSIFLMYGTARHAPANQYGKNLNGKQTSISEDKKLYNAIFGATTAAKISEKQKEIILNAINERMGV